MLRRAKNCSHRVRESGGDGNWRKLDVQRCKAMVRVNYAIATTPTDGYEHAHARAVLTGCVRFGSLSQGGGGRGSSRLDGDDCGVAQDHQVRFEPFSPLFSRGSNAVRRMPWLPRMCACVLTECVCLTSLSQVGGSGEAARFDGSSSSRAQEEEVSVAATNTSAFVRFYHYQARHVAPTLARTCAR